MSGEEVVQQVDMADPGLAEQMAGAQIDRLIETAKRFPRSIKTFRDQSVEMATYDEETAAACQYALPRGGKTISGPSVKFAQIVAACWGNLWVQVTPVAEDKRFVTVRAVAWDVERNVCLAFDVKRRITNSRGHTYNDDMIGVTINAAASIAYRNAVLRIVPESLSRPAMNAARDVIRGDAKTLQERRDKMLQHFASIGVDKDRVFFALGVDSIDGIGLDEFEVLHGMATAIKNDGMDIDTVFPNVTAEGGAVEASGGSKTSALKERLANRGKEGGGAEASKA